MKTLSKLALGGMVLFMAAPAFAVPMAVKNGDGDISITGVDSYQQLSVVYNNIPNSRNVSANECGFIRVSNSTHRPISTTTTFSLDGGAATSAVSALPSEAAPRCTNGALSGTNLTPSSILKTADGDVYFTGLTPWSTHTLAHNDLPTSRNIRANTCGQAAINQSERYVVSGTDSLTVKDRDTGATVLSIANFSQVPSVSGNPICRQGVAYHPADMP